MDSIGEYKIHPVAARFPLLEGEDFEQLVQGIAEHGLRDPIVMAPDGATVVDGRNRLRACIKAGVEPSFRRLGPQFDEWEIVRYLADVNIRRRHLSVGQRAMLAELYIVPELKRLAKERQREAGRNYGRGNSSLSDKKKLNRKTDEAIREGAAPTTNQQAAKTAGVNHSTIAIAKRLADAPDLAGLVISGEVTIGAADRTFKARKADEPKEAREEPARAPIVLVTYDGRQINYQPGKAPPRFNETNDFVSWADWTWNVVTGCLHGCTYCYAREIAARMFNDEKTRRIYPVGFTPLFHSERLQAPANTPVPADVKEKPERGRVFVCSMADLYGAWVPDEWIERVHEVCRVNQQWEYLMLTKFPERYTRLKSLPPTAWLGTSVDEQKRVRLAERAFAQIQGVRVKWLSLEPLREPLEFTDLSMFDWVVIGAQRETVQPDGVGTVPAFAPQFDWVARLVEQARACGCKVWLKPNLLGEITRRNPGMQLPQESPR